MFSIMLGAMSFPYGFAMNDKFSLRSMYFREPFYRKIQQFKTLKKLWKEEEDTYRKPLSNIPGMKPAIFIHTSSVNIVLAKIARKNICSFYTNFTDSRVVSYDVKLRYIHKFYTVTSDRNSKMP